ncbi:MAG: UMP kinase [Lentisphaeria bacterium]|nr:UMP kinase [Lentisphaeria bacterium]
MAEKKLLYKRILLKISGEALKGKQEHGYDSEAVAQVVARIKEALDLGVEIALVVGAGNIWRGLAGSKNGMDRVTADHMGMLATAMNALCLKDAFTAAGVPCSVHSAVAMEPFAKKFDRERALAELSEGKLVIFACGTGSPYFTTDTTAALRALEIKAQAVMKATKVNGIYTADPVKDPSAKKFDKLTFREAVEGRFGVMDSAAFTLCADNDLHIIVFNFSEPGALGKVLSGDYSVGTVVG